MAQARPLTESLILANSYLATSSCPTCYLGPMTQPLPPSGTDEGEAWNLNLQKTRARAIASSANFESLLEKSKPRRSIFVKKYRQSALQGCRACSGVVRYLDHVLPQEALDDEGSQLQVHWWMPHATFQVQWTRRKPPQTGLQRRLRALHAECSNTVDSRDRETDWPSCPKPSNPPFHSSRGPAVGRHIQ